MNYTTNYSKEKCKKYRSFHDQALLKESILMYAQENYWTSRLTQCQVLIIFTRKQTTVNLITKDQILKKPLL